MLQEYKYSVFGEIIEQTADSIANPFTYTAREWDPEVSLYYYRARFYDPRIGRFISEDPSGLSGWDLNLYRYVTNSSLNWVDPFGLWKFSAGIYTPFGGLGIALGDNPNGVPFGTLSFGFGFAAGIGFDPKGTSPGWTPDPCGQTDVRPGNDFTLNLFVEGGVGAILGGLSVGHEAGVHTLTGEHFSNPVSGGQITGQWKLGFGMATGGQITIK